jgi:Na+/melibiose symporter-like transporter
MGLTFGVLFALPFLGTILAARERKDFQKPPDKFDLQDTFLAPFKVKTFVIVLLMLVFAAIAADSVSSITVYFMKYHLGRGEEANYIAGTILVMQVLSLPFYAAYSRRTSKKRAYITGVSIWMGAMLLSFLVDQNSPDWMVYIFAAFVGLGTGGYFISIYAIFPDLPDVDELRTGERREGVFGALITLGRKFSGAVGIFIVSNILAAAGYVTPLHEVTAGVTRVVDQPQSAQFVLTLRLIFVLIPLVLLSSSIFLASKLPLTHQVHARLRQVLAAQREGKPVDESELEDLKRLLI